ncbi:hypothetical protein TcG_10339 [Trypanosoma cruzi]|nr:hypothetical protein TcG_10339 [Trypanosoma cruzi]
MHREHTSTATNSSSRSHGVSLFLTRQHALNNAHIQYNQRDAKKRICHSLHPLRRCRTSSRTAGASLFDGSTAAVTPWQIQLLDGKQSALVTGILNATPLTARTPPTLRPQHFEKIRLAVPVLLPREMTHTCGTSARPPAPGVAVASGK